MIKCLFELSSHATYRHLTARLSQSMQFLCKSDFSEGSWAKHFSIPAMCSVSSCCSGRLASEAWLAFTRFACASNRMGDRFSLGMAISPWRLVCCNRRPPRKQMGTSGALPSSTANMRCTLPLHAFHGMTFCQPGCTSRPCTQEALPSVIANMHCLMPFHAFHRVSANRQCTLPLHAFHGMTFCHPGCTSKPCTRIQRTM